MWNSHYSITSILANVARSTKYWGWLSHQWLQHWLGYNNNTTATWYSNITLGSWWCVFFCSTNSSILSSRGVVNLHQRSVGDYLPTGGSWWISKNVWCILSMYITLYNSILSYVGPVASIICYPCANQPIFPHIHIIYIYTYVCHGQRFGKPRGGWSSIHVQRDLYIYIYM